MVHTFQILASAAAVAAAVTSPEGEFGKALRNHGKLLSWDVPTTCSVLDSIPLDKSVTVACMVKQIDGSKLLELSIDDLNPMASPADRNSWADAMLTWFKVIRAGAGDTHAMQTDLLELRSMDRTGFTRALSWLSAFPRWTTYVYYKRAQAGTPNPLHMFDTDLNFSDFSWVHSGCSHPQP